MILSLVVATLAVARLTRLLTTDRLTVRYRRWVVDRWGMDSKASYLVHCAWCTSFWIALPILPVAALWPNKWVIGVLAAFGASYIAGILARLEE